MEANATCAICNHSYSAAKKPLGLPCSHSFCQDCLKLMEAEGKKYCYSCSVTWNDVKISDLLLCNHQIPAKEGEERASEAVSLNGTCGEHDDEYIFWCETCDVPMCKKCLRLKHNGCQFVLMDEKKDIVQEKHEAELTLLKEKMTKYSTYANDNHENLVFVRSLVEELQSLEIKLLEYQTNVKAWQTEAQKKLSEPAKRPRDLPKLPKQQDSEEFEELERKILSPPVSLLLHVAATYQVSLEDVGAFVSALRSRVKERRAHDKNHAASTRNLVIRKAVQALTEGGDWVVSDTVSSEAVESVLQTSSIRPAKLEIAPTNIPDGSLIKLLTCLEKNKKYPVYVRSETLACFPNSTAACVETRTSTTARLDAWTRSAGWDSLRQFWGHLDEAAVLKLPTTIKRVGLLLRNQEDMAAVNALYRPAFGNNILKYDRSRLRWPGWQDLDLSVAKTFQPDYWKLSWKRNIVHNPTSKPVTLSVLADLGINLCLHLPKLLPGDRRWMGDLFGVMGLDLCKLNGPVSLLLPECRIDPDILLGVLRDSGQHWDVHLPARLPQLVPREEMIARYKKFENTVTWDQE